MILTLIAEIMVGETMVTPGGCIDTLTATGAEPALWGTWLAGLEHAAVDVPAEGAVEILGVSVP